MKFAKPALSIPDQISLLERRGMAVPDKAKATHYLQHISYYRLRAYWLPFEQAAPADSDHSFRPGSSFDDALSLYVFDRHLRLLVMDAVERIEVSLRGNWAHHLAMKYGSHGYIDAANYGHAERYAKALTSLLEEIDRSRDTFIEHYKRKYDDPELPPVWMAAEVMSLGQLSKWLGNLKHRADRQAIAKPYGLGETVVVSIAHHLTYVRNIWRPSWAAVEQAVHRYHGLAQISGGLEAGHEPRQHAKTLQHAGRHGLLVGHRGTGHRMAKASG